MKCSECPWLMVPFFSCKKHGWLIDDGKSVVEGCNIDGKLPPVRESNEDKDTTTKIVK